jgi:hypothetical protein
VVNIEKESNNFLNKTEDHFINENDVLSPLNVKVILNDKPNNNHSELPYFSE